MPDVEFAILGAGAMGSILGAHLARAGHSVVMLARGQRAEQIRREGLRIKGQSEFSTPVQVITDPAQLRSAAVLIVATKTLGTEKALAPLHGSTIEAAFSIQNGLPKNQLLAQALSRTYILGAVANMSGELLPSGEVLFTRNVNVLLGDVTGAISNRALYIARSLNDAGVRATAVPDIVPREWAKFVSWAGLMIMSVTTRVVTWQYLTDPHSALVLVRLVREVVALAKASGVELANEGSILPLSIILASDDLQAAAAIIAAGKEFRIRAPDHRMSSLQDLLAGRPLEVEETLGFAVRKATALKLSLPLLTAFYHLIAAIDRTRMHA